MNHIALKIIICLFSTVSFTQAIGQNFSRFPDSAIDVRKKNAAIHAANAYISANLLNRQHSQWFLADSNASLLICNDYKTFFNSSSASCLPVGYEVGFHVLLKNESAWDTLHTNLFLRQDSLFAVSEDALSGRWNKNLLTAWEKIIAKEFKFNYADVLQFVKGKRLQQYSIDFGYEKTGFKQIGKIYWFVTAPNGMRSFLYRIDPETGAVKVKKLLQLKLPREVS